MRLPTFREMFRQFPASQTGWWLRGGAFAAALFFAICLAALVAASSDVDRRASAAASSVAAIAGYDIGRTIEQFDRVLQATVERLQSPTVMALEPGPRNLALFGPAFALPHLGFINVLDPAGSVREAPEPFGQLSNWGGRDYFTGQRLSSLPGLYIGKPFSHDEFASIALSRRVPGPDGAFGGVVVASLRLNYFRELFSQFALGAHGTITLLRDDGVALVRLPLNRNDEQQPTASEPRHFAAQRIGTWPLSLQVGIASQDVPGGWQGWVVALVVAGGLLGLVTVGLLVVLQMEVWRRQTAERDNRHKSDYLSMASHELRTPLHTILGSADRLRANAHLDPDEARRVAAIVSAGHHLRGVVDRVLNRLHVESRIPTPSMSRVDLRKLLDKCCIIVEWDAAERGLGLHYDLKAGAPETFVTDHVLLRQILVNLLSNAVKFTSQGEVKVGVSGTAEQITIEVKDTGCGVPPEQRHKLFVQGERLGAEHTGIPGHGFGLALTQRLVQSMGGAIGFRENPAGGAIFWVTLPAGQTSEQVSTASCDPRMPPARSLRVLLVDDVAANREIARHYLVNRGHTVTEAAGGAEAMRLASDNDFDVVLMDMRMPGVDGLETTKRIRTIDGPRGQVPIVAVTANALDHQILEGRRAGMVDHLTKPFTPDELLAVVERVTGSHAFTPHTAPKFDATALGGMADFMSSGQIEQHLLDLAQKVEALLPKLDEAEAAREINTIRELSHQLAGTAGTFGFAALSEAALGFERGIAEDPTSVPQLADALRVEAHAALNELRDLTSAEPVGAG